jgi:hypothetical protein
VRVAIDSIVSAGFVPAASKTPVRRAERFSPVR